MLDGSIHSLRAKAYLALGDIDRCVEDCTQALRLRPGLVPALVTRARALQRRQDWAGCAADCGEILTAHPEHSMALLLRAQAALHLKEYTECVEDCNVALMLDPDVGHAAVLRCTRAEARRQRGNLHDAADDAGAALAHDPTLPQPYLTLASIYIANNQIPQAMGQCTKGLQHHPLHPELLVHRARCHLELKQWLQCIRDCTDVIQAQQRSGSPSDGWMTTAEVLGVAYSTRAAAFLVQGNGPKCIEDCKKALKCNPDLGVAYTSRALARRREGDPQGCLADCTAAISLDAGDCAAYLLRAETLATLGEYQQCIEDCTEAIELQPSDGAAFALRGAARRLLKDYEGCLQDCSDAILRDPECAMAFANRAAAARHLGDYPSAVADAKAALRLQPDYAFAQRQLEKLKLHPANCGCFGIINRWRKRMYSKF